MSLFKRKNRICFCASSGGHFEEISRLKNLAQKCESFYIIERSSYQKTEHSKNYYLNSVNRKNIFFIPLLGLIFFKTFFIFIKEKPDCVISTGALFTIPIMLVGKIMRKKVIYIESLARVNSPSLTGKFAYQIADLFIVQWDSLLKVFPKAVLGGPLY